MIKYFGTKAISQFNKLKLNGLQKIFHKNSELNKKTIQENLRKFWPSDNNESSQCLTINSLTIHNSRQQTTSEQCATVGLFYLNVKKHHTIKQTEYHLLHLHHKESEMCLLKVAPIEVVSKL